MTDLLHGDKSTTLPHASPKSDKTRRRFLMFGAAQRAPLPPHPCSGRAGGPRGNGRGETQVAGVSGNRARAQLLRNDAHLIAMDPARRVLTLASPH